MIQESCQLTAVAAYVAAIIIFNRITLSQQHPTAYNIYHIAAKSKDN